MRHFRNNFEPLAIGLSLTCAIHCLSIPLLMLLVPGVAVWQLNHEGLHLGLVLLVLPISGYAMYYGYTSNKQLSHSIIISLGLVLLVLAVVFESRVPPLITEMVLTLTGSILLITGHWANMRSAKRLFKKSTSRLVE